MLRTLSGSADTGKRIGQIRTGIVVVDSDGQIVARARGQSRRLPPPALARRCACPESAVQAQIEIVAVIIRPR